jgi:metal-dependent HD superfamily phosphatase/phosphodiesterase
LVGKPPPRHHIDETDMTVGTMRNPMRRLGTTILALSAANAWSFMRPSDRRVVRIETGYLSHRQQSGRYPRKSD